MHFHLSALAAVAAFSPALAAYKPESVAATDAVAASSLGKLKTVIADGSLKSLLATKGVSQTCKLSTAAIRREYSTLTDQEKRDYTNSVKCLMTKPSKLAAGRAAGAKTRYDDFVAVHANQTMTIHSTGNFLSWHRYFLYAFERALRDECGYKGYVPYWNWGKSAQDILNSPYFDGSELSQGGNGVWEPHNCTRRTVDSACITEVVQGRGGGCVKTGPYKDMVVNVGAFDPWFNNPGEKKTALNAFDPRCLKRDISPEYARAMQGDDKLVTLLSQPTLATFQDTLQGGPNLHGVGHFVYGGNPGGDLFISPGDPQFWLLHSMVDRVWWIWQNQDPLTRTMTVDGVTVMMVPTSPKTTLEDLLDIDVLTPSGMPTKGSPISQHVSTVGGPYCYAYLSKKSCKPKKRDLGMM